MNADHKEELIIKTFHLEFKLLREEIRLNWACVIFCITCAILIPFLALLIADFFSQFFRMVVLLVSATLSIFFALLGLVFLGIVVNLALKLTEIEEQLNKTLDKDVIHWETSIGLFIKPGGDILVDEVNKYIAISGMICFVVGMIPVAINLWLGFDIMYNFFGKIVLIPITIYSVTAIVTIVLGMKFWYQKKWEKINL